MRIYAMTDIGDSEASAPVSNPSPARRLLYYLRKRANKAASDDMITQSVFNGDRGQAQMAISKCLNAKAIKSIGG